MDASITSILGLLVFISVWIIALKGLISASKPIFRFLRGKHQPAKGPAFRPYYSDRFHQAL